MVHSLREEGVRGVEIRMMRPEQSPSVEEREG